MGRLLGQGGGTAVNAEPADDPGYKRKLIEVALPLEDINREAAREKSIRHGHPSTLHLWWARRPLAAARAVLFAQLVDDPSAHSDRFPTPESQQAERERLFAIIRDLVKWENSSNETVLAAARKEIWDSCDGSPPPILDPFAGGGSIPLEAQRLGLEAHASDLNPVAVLINKALIEIPSKWAGKPPVHPDAKAQLRWRGAEGLAEDVRCYGKWIRDEAECRIGHLYPKAKLDDGTLAPVIAWIWARTVTCPNPACGGTMPLVRSFWLGKKKGKERYVHPVSDGKQVRFEIRGPRGTPRDGTVSRTGAECLLCGAAVPLTHVRAEGKAGRMGAQLMAIAAEGKRTRYYLPPSDEHERAASVPRSPDVPDAELPDQALGFRVQGYGMTTWADLFTNRQLTALTTFSDLVSEVRVSVNARSASPAYADAVATYLGFALSRIAGSLTSLATWNASPSKESVTGAFRIQALAMTWDFGESNPFLIGQPTEFFTSTEWVSRTLDFLPEGTGIAIQADASVLDYRIGLVVTDPPYYDNIGYADLADFFYVWLRRSLGEIYPDLMGTVLTPKADELVADPFRHEDAPTFFENAFRKVFRRIWESAKAGYPITVIYAFKQAEAETSGDSSTGWETLLEGMIQSGWQVTGTWPIRTERTGRSRDIEANALASSIVLACRPRGEGAETTDRRGFLAMMREELPGRLKELQQGNIAPVDLAQAAIGPGMAVFSRHRQVTEPDGSAMRVRTALQLINQVLDEVLAEQEGDFDTDSRWCVRWFEQYEWTQGDSGTAETLANARNTSLPGLEQAGVIRARAGKTRLLRAEELPDGYDPVTDERPTMWEAVLHLSRLLEQRGPESAGLLMRRLEPVLDLNGVKELAYLLYSVCDRRRRQESALIFNNLVTSWPEITDSAQKAPGMADHQQAMDFADEELAGPVREPSEEAQSWR
jgi:putative DNA methylase